MQQQQQQQPKKITLNVLDIPRGYATCVTVFLREGFGKRALLGWPGVVAFVIMWIMSYADPVMQVFFWLWCMAFVFQVLDTSRRITKGEKIHSQYHGFPVMAMKGFRCQKENVAKMLEIPLVCIVGAVSTYLSPTLGAFLIGGGMAMAFVRMIDQQMTYKAVEEITDAGIEAEWMNSYVRGERDDF